MGEEIDIHIVSMHHDTAYISIYILASFILFSRLWINHFLLYLIAWFMY
jgi:hypothetical protein